MRIETKELGIIDINQNEIITFTSAIYGFEKDRKFVLLKDDDEENPFMWLQSVENKEPCFVVIDPLSLFEDYSPFITKSDKEKIDFQPGDELKLLSLVTIPHGNIEKSVLNLKCPVVINSSNYKAVQIIQDNDRCPMRQPLFGGGEGFKCL